MLVAIAKQDRQLPDVIVGGHVRDADPGIFAGCICQHNERLPRSATPRWIDLAGRNRR